MDTATVGSSKLGVTGRAQAATVRLVSGPIRRDGSDRLQRGVGKPVERSLRRANRPSTEEMNNAQRGGRRRGMWRGLVISAMIHGAILVGLSAWRWVVVAADDSGIWFEQPVELLRVGELGGEVAADDEVAGGAGLEGVDLKQVPLFTRPAMTAEPRLPELTQPVPVGSAVIAVDVERAPRGVMFAVAPVPGGASERELEGAGTGGSRMGGGESYGGRGRWGGLVRVSGARPEYPAVARENRWEGVTVLRFEVQGDGTVGFVEVASSSGYAVLDEAAKQAVQQWRFVPLKRNGQPVRVVVEQAIAFRLDRS